MELESERLQIAAGLGALDATRTRATLFKAMGRTGARDVVLIEPLDVVSSRPLHCQTRLFWQRDLKSRWFVCGRRGRGQHAPAIGQRSSRSSAASLATNGPSSLMPRRGSIPPSPASASRCHGPTATTGTAPPHPPSFDGSEALLDAARTDVLADYHAALDDYTMRHEQITNIVIPLRQHASNSPDCPGGLHARRDRSASLARCQESSTRGRTGLDPCDGRLATKCGCREIRRRRDQMNRATYVCPVFFTCLLAGCGGSAPSKERETAKAAETKKDVIVLSPAEQVAGKIETQTVAMTDTPPVVRVSGRIARADDHTWHVGVRTVGVVASVSAAVGSYVKQGDVMARYHADEARELLAQYRRAIADVHREETAAALAQRAAERQQTLLSLKASSVQQVEQAQQEVVAAQARLGDEQVEVERAKEALEHDLKVPATPAAGVASGAEDQVPIIAPASGYVLEKNITPGKTVELSTDAFVIGDLSHGVDAGGRSAGTVRTAAHRTEGDRQRAWPRRRVVRRQDHEPRPGARSADARDAGADRAGQSAVTLRPEMLANADIPDRARRRRAADCRRRRPADSMARTWSSCEPRPTVRGAPVRVGSDVRRQNADARGLERRRADRRAGQLRPEVATASSHDGRRIGEPCSIESSTSRSQYRWLVLVGIIALLGVGGYALVHHSRRGVSRPDEQPGGRRDGSARAAADRSRAAGDLSDRASDARPAEQGGGAVAVEARAVDGDGGLRRFACRCISRGSW